MLAAGAQEGDLTLYFWDGNDWAALDTELNTYFNLASAPSEGGGIYALMASAKIPLYGPGWNLVSYPVPGTRTISEALRSISGTYAIVYGYVVTDTIDPWRVYGIGAPAYVNRLHTLRFGQGYWISVTEPITWHLGGNSAQQALDVGDAQSPQGIHNMQDPPATYYGRVLASQDFTPAAGMAVDARVGGDLCGQGWTMVLDDEIVYIVHVLADGPGRATGCGAPGRKVVFRVDGQAMIPTRPWNNNRLYEVALSPGMPLEWSVYLPLVMRH